MLIEGKHGFVRPVGPMPLTLIATAELPKDAGLESIPITAKTMGIAYPQ
jgi:hypothetical protein